MSGEGDGFIVDGVGCVVCEQDVRRNRVCTEANRVRGKSGD